MFGHTLGTFSDGFGIVSGTNYEEVDHIQFSNSFRSIFSSVGLLVTIMFSRLPDEHTGELEI